MAVLLETTAGDIVIDLLVDSAPKLCENFLKLCKTKYYNFSPVHSVNKNSYFQTGDPLGPLSLDSDGGSSIWGNISGRLTERTFPALSDPKLKHAERGTVSMVTSPSASDPDIRMAASQFIITLGEKTEFLDGQAVVFGKVAEGFDTLEKINESIVDEKGYPFVDIRIKHTFVIDDPYPDPAGLREPSASPPPTDAQMKTVRIADEAALHEDDGVDEEVLERRRRDREAHASAVFLELVGDLPFAEVKPPENVLFVAKLNPVTADEDLELIFGRFGKIISCEVIRDAKTGDSLQYAFIEYEEKASCEAAYFKMQDVLIDDRRIHVDFSQSVSKISDTWRKNTNMKRKAHASRGRHDRAEGSRHERAEGDRRERVDHERSRHGRDAGGVRSPYDRRDVESGRPRHERDANDGRARYRRDVDDDQTERENSRPRYRRDADDGRREYEDSRRRYRRDTKDDRRERENSRLRHRRDDDKGRREYEDSRPRHRHDTERDHRRRRSRSRSPKRRDDGGSYHR